MTKCKINGTWFEFTHPNREEGKYWNESCRSFTEDEWRGKVREIAGTGMKYLVLMASSLVRDDMEESYFDTGPYPFPEDFACADPMEAMLDEADRQGMKVFMSCGFYGNWADSLGNMNSEDVRKRAFAAMDELYRLFGNHESFYGWYLPDELGLDRDGFPSSFLDYVHIYHEKIRRINPDHKVLIAPYGVAGVNADDKFVEQLKLLDCDFVAYQDGIGVRHSTLDKSAGYYAALKAAHDKAARSKIWADVELFTFEGETYHSALVPADASRVRRQLDAVAPYVDEILVYQYTGLMNSPESTAFCGHPESVKLYHDLMG